MKKSTIQFKRLPKLAFLFLTCIAALSLGSCKKDAAGGSASNTSLLTSAPWKSTKLEWRATVSGSWITKPGTTTAPQETVTFFDNSLFASSGAYGTSGSGTWQLSQDKTKLTLIGSNGTSATYAVTVTSSTLQLSTPLVNEYVTSYDPATKTYAYTYYDMEMETFSH